MFNQFTKTLAAAATAVAVIAAPATADRISILLGSEHTGLAGSYEEFNPGVFYTWDDYEPVDWTVGVFRNSYGNVSVAGYGSVPFAQWDNGEASVIAGVAHYPERANDMPYAVGEFVPMAGVGVIHENLFVQVFPRGFDPFRATIAAGVTFNIGQ